MMSESEQGVESDRYVPGHKQHWRYLALVLVATIAGAALLAGSLSGKTVSLNTSSPEGTVGLAEEADCGCMAKKDAAFQACPAPSWSRPFENAACKKDAVKEAAGCLQACAKDHADSAKKAAADAAQKAKDGVGSAKDHADAAKKAAADAVQKAKDGVGSAIPADAAQKVKDGVGSAIQSGKDTVESVTEEAKRRKECFEKLVPCIKECGIDVPADANELANVDTHEIADSSKKCVKKCEDDAKDCTALN